MLDNLFLHPAEVKNKKDNIKKLLTAKKKQAEVKEDKLVDMKQAM
jgi:hypothetical protein